MLLSAYLLLQDEHSGKSENELTALLTEKGPHNLCYIRDQIGAARLKSLGIKSITLEGKGTHKRARVKFIDDATVDVQDIVEIRYDYKYTCVRGRDEDESKKLAEATKRFITISKKIMSENVPQ